MLQRIKNWLAKDWLLDAISHLAAEHVKHSLEILSLQERVSWLEARQMKADRQMDKEEEENFRRYFPSWPKKLKTKRKRNEVRS